MPHLFNPALPLINSNFEVEPNLASPTQPFSPLYFMSMRTATSRRSKECCMQTFTSPQWPHRRLFWPLWPLQTFSLFLSVSVIEINMCYFFRVYHMNYCVVAGLRLVIVVIGLGKNINLVYFSCYHFIVVLCNLNLRYFTIAVFNLFHSVLYLVAGRVKLIYTQARG